MEFEGLWEDGQSPCPGEIRETLSECVLLAWTQPCQGPQCFRSMEMAKAPLGPNMNADSVCQSYQPQVSLLGGSLRLLPTKASYQIG